MAKRNKILPEQEGLSAADWARAISYALFAAWTVVFALYPPVAFETELGTIYRLVWMGVTLLGALASLAGSLSRVDIKLELPGIAILVLGPLFYFVSQFYYVAVPSVAINDPTQRYALVIYALLPAALLAPRAIELICEAKKLRQISENATIISQHLAEAERVAQEAAARESNGGN